MSNKKVRTPIPPDVAAEVMFQHHSTCCVCRDSGKRVQIHHIDEDPSNNDPANLAVLCFDDHDETQVSGGFGRKLLGPTVIRYRDEWIRAVSKRRADADKIATAKMAGLAHAPGDEVTTTSWNPPSEVEMASFIASLPQLRRAAYAGVSEDFESGVTMRVAGAGRDLADIFERVLVRLASAYPPNHFATQTAEQYFNSYVASRSLWHRAIYDPEEYGSGGTIVHFHVAFGVLKDLSDTICNMVEFHLLGDDYTNWKARWDAAIESSPKTFSERIKSAMRALRSR